jgi:dTDP-4-dehydrorhamnose reductase
MSQALAEARLEPVLLPQSALDVTDREAVQAAVSRSAPGAVVHLAAMTDVDTCEIARRDAVAVNLAGTEHVATACRACDALLIYVGTGGVFGGVGTDGPFHELDVPKPANWYATTKLWGEVAAQRAPRHAVVRAGWIVGGGTDDPKFVGKMLRMIESESHVRAVGDRLGTLTFASELARFLAAVASAAVEGLWHFASDGVVTRYDIAAELVALAGVEVQLERVPEATFPAPAPRGRSEALTSVRSFGTLPQPSPWRAGLRAYLSTEGMMSRTHSDT